MKEKQLKHRLENKVHVYLPAYLFVKNTEDGHSSKYADSYIDSCNQRNGRHVCY